MTGNWFKPELKSLIGGFHQDEYCGNRRDRRSSRVKRPKLKGLDNMYSMIPTSHCKKINKTRNKCEDFIHWRWGENRAFWWVCPVSFTGLSWVSKKGTVKALLVCYMVLLWFLWMKRRIIMYLFKGFFFLYKIPGAKWILPHKAVWLHISARTAAAAARYIGPYTDYCFLIKREIGGTQTVHLSRNASGWLRSGLPGVSASLRWLRDMGRQAPHRAQLHYQLQPLLYCMEHASFKGWSPAQISTMMHHCHQALRIIVIDMTRRYRWQPWPVSHRSSWQSSGAVLLISGEANGT